MNFLQTEQEQQKQAAFTTLCEAFLEQLSPYDDCVDLTPLKEIVADFREKCGRFAQEDRKLSIGVIGQVKAGKSTFLNNLLFQGNDVLPSAKTPKTATLTSICYAQCNEIVIEYYAPNEWQTLQRLATSATPGNEAEAAREIMKMVQAMGTEPMQFLSKGQERIAFDSAEKLMCQLNQYVGENGAYTPFVKTVFINIDQPELQDICVVDTPGLNDAIASRTEKTRQFLSQCDVVFFLSRASQFLDKVDVELMTGQLPQKGVGKLVLICSRFDEGLLDELRRYKNLPDTMDAVRQKLTAKAEQIMDEQIKLLQRNYAGADANLIAARADMFCACRKPVFIASLPQRMSIKTAEQYSDSEAHVFKRLNKYGGLTPEMLSNIGNIGEVQAQFSAVVKQKDAYLLSQMKNMLPQAQENWAGALAALSQEAARTKNILETKDCADLQQKSSDMQSQIHGIQASIEAVLGELLQKLEQAKNRTLRELRETRSRYAAIQTHQGTEDHVSHSTVYDHHFLCFKWGKHTATSHYTTTYTYLAAADALENIRNFGNEACSEIEAAFYQAIDIKATKKQMLNVITQQLDTSDESFDANHFRLMTEKTLNCMEFPVMSLDVSAYVNQVSASFSGEIRDSSERANLQNTLSQTVSDLLVQVETQYMALHNQFRKKIVQTQDNFTNQLLHNIRNDFDQLQRRFQNKEYELRRYCDLIDILK